MCKESSSQRLTARRGVTKSNLQKQNTSYVFLLTSMRISEAFYVNKAHVSHPHDPSKPNTSITYHVGAAFTWNAVMDNTEPPQVNIGDGAAEKFLDQVLAAATICRQHLANKIPMKQLTQEQWRGCNNTTNCLFYAKLFKSVDKIVRDHDHLTGEYRGRAYNACNLNYRVDPKKVSIPCIIHNLKGILFLRYSYFHSC